MKYRCPSILVICLWLSPAVLFAEGGPSLFTDLIPDARSAGMGGTGVASTSDAYALYHNGAGSVFSDWKGQAGYGFTPWMRNLSSGSTLHSVAGFGRLGERQSVLAGFRYLSLPEMFLTDDRGNGLGTVRPSDMTVEVGYARRLVRGFSASLTARYIRSDAGLDETASAVGFDAGLYYRHSAVFGRRSGSWTLGAQFSNFGTQLDYGYRRLMLPWKIVFGGAVVVNFSDDHRIEATAEAELKCYSYGSAYAGGRFGAEYTLFRHAVLRAGYRLGNGSQGDCSYTSVGCGVRIDRFCLDGAYWLAGKETPLRNTWQLSLRVGWGVPSGRR